MASGASLEVHGGGNRLRWDDAPPLLRSAVQRLAGGAVVAAKSSVGGFSPGMASTLTLDDGRRVFVKAASEATSHDAYELYRRERETILRLPASIPHAHLIASEERDGWIVLLYKHIDGRHPVPGDRADLHAILDAFNNLTVSSDPSPLPLPRFEDRWAWHFDSWNRALQETPDAIQLDPWIKAHFEAVRQAASGWRSAVAGDALVHGDLRPDNMLLTSEGVMVILDWPEASQGAAWLDMVLALPDMAMFSGAPSIQRLADDQILQRVEPGALTVVVAALAGFFLCSSTLPTVPALPTLRSFQQEQGTHAAAWLQSLMGRDAGL